MARFRFLTICCLCFCLVTGLQWTSTLQEGQVLYACTGQDITIPWSFSLSTGEQIDSIEWLFRGMSEEAVAMFQQNSFVPLPAFSQRVQYVANGGLTLRHVTPGDSGNYSVDVTTQNTSGTSFNKFHFIILSVSDGLPTADGELRMTQKQDAILDTSSQRWSIVLTCGNFPSVNQPPFPVEWVTPTGQVLASSNYSGGQFLLYVSSPVPDGSYTCRVPQENRTAACLQGNNNTGAEASMVVSGVTASVQVMAAELTYLERQNEELENTVALLVNLTNEQQDTIDSLTGACRSDSHTVIDDYRREINYNESRTICDMDLAEGWYRFLLNGTNAIIPTSCVEQNHCGTRTPYWLDLQGQASPVAGEQVQGRGCARWSSSCCMDAITPISIRNCGHYFIYQLKPAYACSFGYCAQVQP